MNTPPYCGVVLTALFLAQQHYWHIKNVLTSSHLTVRNEKDLRALVKDARRSYFVEADYERALTYLKRVGAVRKHGRTLQWKERQLTEANLQFLNTKSK